MEKRKINKVKRNKAVSKELQLDPIYVMGFALLILVGFSLFGNLAIDTAALYITVLGIVYIAAYFLLGVIQTYAASVATSSVISATSVSSAASKASKASKTSIQASKTQKPKKGKAKAKAKIVNKHDNKIPAKNEDFKIQGVPENSVSTKAAETMKRYAEHG